MLYVESGISRDKMVGLTLQKRMYRDQLSIWNADVNTSLENLLVRFEEPSSMVRWDSPLFTILWTEVDIPSEDIWRVVTSGDVKSPNAGTAAVRTSVYGLRLAFLTSFAGSESTL
jgi:tRNA uridine 5-carbamoylmethylation protein Kti12